MKLKLQVPQGTADMLPGECRKKRWIEANIKEEFLLSGYNEVSTPGFEYYDVFTHDAVPYVQENMIRFFDGRGRLLALRPDSTGPIARMAATKLLNENDILRLCYVQDAFGSFSQGIDKKTEFTQAGVELIGKSGEDADAEVIALAIRTFLKLGLKEFIIDIGQVAFFKGLLSGCELLEEQVEKIRTLVDTKNNVELEFELSRLPIDRHIKKALLALGGLFGGEEVFERALSLAHNEQCKAAVRNLRGVYDMLCDFGYKDYISIDFGILNDFNYYTGIIFRGVTKGLGAHMLSGGRYDKLLIEFGKDTPATGFAIKVREIMTAISNGEWADAEKTLVLRCSDGARGKAYAKAAALRSEGKRVIMELNGKTYEPSQFEVIDID